MCEPSCVCNWFDEGESGVKAREFCEQSSVWRRGCQNLRGRVAIQEMNVHGADQIHPLLAINLFPNPWYANAF
jgi:hypothetical protein